MKEFSVESNNGLFALRNIPFEIDVARAAGKLRIAEGTDDFTVLEEMIQTARREGSPKAIYRIAYPELRGEDTVIIDGIKLNSRVLKVNLENIHRVFLYVATCGRELESWSRTYTDPLFAYFADYVKVSVLQEAIKFFTYHIKKTYRISEVSRMAPGSLKDWPIEQQKPFFEIMGDVEGTTGVTLTESFLMQPSKSASGVLFPTKTFFESCMLCPRENCIGRRAPYNGRLYEEKYRGAR